MLRLLCRFLAGAILAVLLVAGVGAASEPVRIVMVTHGQAGDPFWGIVRKGANAAAAAFGVALDYRAPERFDMNEMAVLIERAIAEGPDGLVVSLPDPDALAPQVRKAAVAGIPVVTINSGSDVALGLGSRLHVGQNEYEAGRVAGERLRSLGGTTAICLNHEAGNIALGLRCKGFIDTFRGSVEVVPTPADAGEVQAAIAAKLADNADIDTVLATSASFGGEPALAAVVAAGRPVTVASFDLSVPFLEAVRDGRAAFALDQQPFLQGYLPVEFLALLKRYGTMPVGEVSSGPQVIDQANAAAVLAGVAAGIR